MAEEILVSYESYKEIVGMGTAGMDINIILTRDLLKVLKSSNEEWIRSIPEHFNIKVEPDEFNSLLDLLKDKTDLDDICVGGSTLN